MMRYQISFFALLCVCSLACGCNSDANVTSDRDQIESFLEENPEQNLTPEEVDAQMAMPLTAE
ncbi:hypothetical protein SAMN06265222_11526 [Neorhodopirellula lusitana]|uniref:Secreted protein n=1 Tax=Neorhodopirellula lusitana TaxID=445327 RepID=A0ABY1QKE0_9BACT|nr:hypothetical protein [Neorhodopirellula lusitana]SMP72255.1 hypothetical protein SAMN06265222_11526 [Neorhodopirellula lusitana]